jgi:predicted short-subunit dehydrogenase-like oxidoreductase (DUF2520 family)
MLPGMSAKRGVAIVGAGNLAAALAVSLRRAGYEIEAVISQARPASRRKAQSLAREVGARVWVDPPPKEHAEVVWFCVPDAEIARAARSLAGKIDWKGRVALHSSGALASDELDVLRGHGAAVASVHPLMTFVRGSRPWLAGVPFAVEGDEAAVRVARRIVKNLGGNSHSIRKQDKPAYHAWATFASPLLTALLATSEQIAAAAGVDQESARRMMIPILQQTLANYAALSAPAAFSGPIIRGDADTVKRHLRALRQIPLARAVYTALARAAAEYLPSKNKPAIKKVLSSNSR